MKKSPEVETPEAWDLSRVRLTVQAVSDGADVGAATRLSSRHVGYHLQAGRILGWLAGDNKHPTVTDAGRALLAAPRDSAQEAEALRSAVSECAAVKVVVGERFSGITFEELVAALESSPLTGLARSTAKKRAAALLRWRDRTQSATPELPSQAESARCERILVLQFSDIHTKDHADRQRLEHRLSRAISAVAARPEIYGIRECLVIISGDISYSGTTSQFELASSALESALGKLKSRLSLNDVQVVVTPGNHDCDFTVESKARGKLISSVDPADVDVSYVEACTSTQTSFWKFASFWHTGPTRSVEKKVAMEIHRISIAGRTIHVNSLNTAWMSTIDEKQGALVFPSSGITALRAPSPAPDVVITVGHHGYNWFEANNARALRTSVETCSDILFSGHEHMADSTLKLGSAGDTSWHIEGGVLNDSTTAENSSFNAVILDIAGGELRALSFRWNDADDMYVIDRESSPVAFQRNQLRMRSEFQLNQAFQAALNDPGESYQHPRKSPIRLQDLFVYPNLEERVHEKHADVARLIRTPIDFILREQCVLVLAPERAGKTAMARMLFSDLYRLGFVPVLIDGRQLDNPAPERVNARADESFVEGYDRALLERFRQLDPAKRVCIVDDLHRSPLNIAAKDKAIGVLASFADMVVVFTDENFDVAAVSGPTQSSHLWDFSHCTMLPLGHRVRYDLVSRWCNLGRGHGDDPDAVSRETERRDRTVTRLIGQNFLPAYPVFVLLCLQQLEIKAPESNLGSFGHLYEALLTRNLISGGSSSGMDLDAKQQFLSHFAFHLFESGSESTDRTAFNSCYDEYCERFHVRFSLEQLEKELLASLVFEVKSGRYCFKYQYAYLFFVARYLRDRLDETRIRGIVVELCRKLHHEHSANILLFLCHLSKHPFVLDTLLEAARSLFSDGMPLDMETALSPIHQRAEPRTLRLEGGDHRENRRALRDIRDQGERSRGDRIDHDGLPPEVMTFTAAYKTVHILGQVLRGFPGSIPGDKKLEIASECYSLGLRSTRALMEMIIASREEIEAGLCEVIGSRRPGLRDDSDKLQNAARRMLFDLCESMCFGTIQHISDAVGLQTLSRTYDEVLKKHSPISYRIVDLSVHLDHFDEFPQTQLDGLLRDAKGKVLPMNLIGRLVWRHMYLFPVNPRLIQSLCSKLNIQFTLALKSSGKGRS
ncbi:MAG: metallophosphoesterase family protein [Myxococcales bacterium]